MHYRSATRGDYCNRACSRNNPAWPLCCDLAEEQESFFSYRLSVFLDRLRKDLSRDSVAGTLLVVLGAFLTVGLVCFFLSARGR